MPMPLSRTERQTLPFSAPPNTAISPCSAATYLTALPRRLLTTCPSFRP